MAVQCFLENDKMPKYVVHNGTAGQIADDSSQDFESQLNQILAKIDKQLADIGIDRKHLLSAIVCRSGAGSTRSGERLQTRS